MGGGDRIAKQTTRGKNKEKAKNWRGFEVFTGYPRQGRNMGASAQHGCA